MRLTHKGDASIFTWMRLTHKGDALIFTMKLTSGNCRHYLKGRSTERLPKIIYIQVETIFDKDCFFIRYKNWFAGYKKLPEA